jgi:hypothetical protein
MNDVIHNLRYLAKDLDISLARTQMIADELLYYISSLSFIPAGWIDSEPFSEDLYITICNNNGQIRVYDKEQDRYFSIYELEEYQILSLAFRLIELINRGTINLVNK